MGTVSEELADLDIIGFLQALEDGGWYEFVFPFLLVYAVVFTILNKVDLFENKKPVKVIIALVFALFAIAFPITGEGADCSIGCGQTLGDLMMTLFPGVTAFSIAVLSLYIVAAMLGIDLMKFFGDNNQDNWLKYVLGGLGLIVVIYYYGLGFEWWGNGDYGSFDWLLGDGEGILRDPVLYLLLVFGLFFWWVSKDDDNGDDAAKSATKARNAAREAELASRE